MPCDAMCCTSTYMSADTHNTLIILGYLSQGKAFKEFVVSWKLRCALHKVTMSQWRQHKTTKRGAKGATIHFWDSIGLGVLHHNLRFLGVRPQYGRDYVAPIHSQSSQMGEEKWGTTRGNWGLQWDYVAMVLQDQQ